VKTLLTIPDVVGGYTFDCSVTPPDFNVAIGGKTFTVPGKYIVYAPLSAGSSKCFGGIQANTGIGFNIFGDVFLKAVYAIFDDSSSSPRLGFAAQSS
jgi:aspergillopepsin I